MMPQYGRISQSRLKTCHDNLQDVFKDVIFSLPWVDPVSKIVITDCSILCGHRDEVSQDLAYKMGNSDVQWPSSMHNQFPSKAIDAAPYHNNRPHIHWKDIDEMEAFKRLVFKCAKDRDLKLRWGGDWDGDGVRVDKDPDERLLDAVHFELVSV